MEKVTITTLQPEHYQELLKAMKATYPNWAGTYWQRGTIEHLLKSDPADRSAHFTGLIFR